MLCVAGLSDVPRPVFRQPNLFALPVHRIDIVVADDEHERKNPSAILVIFECPASRSPYSTFRHTTATSKARFLRHRPRAAPYRAQGAGLANSPVSQWMSHSGNVLMRRLRTIRVRSMACGRARLRRHPHLSDGLTDRIIYRTRQVISTVTNSNRLLL